MSTHVVIGGAGQIGHAIASVLEERHEVYRVDPPAGLYEIPSDGVHVMHVAIRWSDTFEQDVQDYIERFDPSLVAVHSTDRKSTRLNSSHVKISYAVFCLKKKKKYTILDRQP